MSDIYQGGYHAPPTMGLGPILAQRLGSTEDYLNTKIGCLLERRTALTVDTTPDIVWDTVITNQGGMWNSGSPEIIIPPDARGDYLVVVQFTFADVINPRASLHQGRRGFSGSQQLGVWQLPGDYPNETSGSMMSMAIMQPGKSFSVNVFGGARATGTPRLSFAQINVRRMV